MVKIQHGDFLTWNAVQPDFPFLFTFKEVPGPVLDILGIDEVVLQDIRRHIIPLKDASTFCAEFR
jgi:hypothetical protein